MPVIVQVEHEHVGDIDAVRRRLADSGHVRRALGDLLDESAHVGAHSIRLYAPKGASGDIPRATSSEHAALQPSGSLEAAAGVLPVEGRRFPLYVHEGTGLFGRFRRRISPRRARAMRFIGRTGLVFARSVAGQRPQPYVAEAFEDVKAYVDQRIDSMVRRVLETDV